MPEIAVTGLQGVRLPIREGWQREAACTPEMAKKFQPTTGASLDPAKAVCAQCPVRLDCLYYALVYREPEGVWGGYGPEERRQMLADLGAGFGVAS